jgi:hypothetical protein
MYQCKHVVTSFLPIEKNYEQIVPWHYLYTVVGMVRTYLWYLVFYVLLLLMMQSLV